MECMSLLLGERICDSSTAVKYLTTEMPDMRSRAIRPISLIDDDEKVAPVYCYYELHRQS